MPAEHASSARSPRPLRLRLRRVLHRLRRDQGGAAAVEFGIVAMPFCALVFATLETASIFWTSQVLETAVQDATRQIYTGQFQQDPGNSGKTSAQLAANLKTLICNNVKTFF